MKNIRRLTKPVSHLVILTLLAFSLHFPVAHAGIVSTEALANATQVQQNRERLHDLLKREDVQAQLLASGVDPAQVQARVDNMTDAEVQTMASNMDQLPAGSGIVGALVLVFLVLLVTDILGLTDVFPFVKHNR